jgi:hypothetical protein
MLSSPRPTMHAVFEGTIVKVYEFPGGWKIWAWLFGILGLIFVYRSTYVVIQLSANPPPEFVDSRSEWTAQQRQTEQRLARAYWQCAVRVMQRRYAYGSGLPDKPPPEFKIDAQSFPDLPAGAHLERDRYWQNLRKVWGDPDVWARTYAWDTSWLSRGQ